MKRNALLSLCLAAILMVLWVPSLAGAELGVSVESGNTLVSPSPQSVQEHTKRMQAGQGGAKNAGAGGGGTKLNKLSFTSTNVVQGNITAGNKSKVNIGGLDLGTGDKSTGGGAPAQSPIVETSNAPVGNNRESSQVERGEDISATSKVSQNDIDPKKAAEIAKWEEELSKAKGALTQAELSDCAYDDSSVCHTTYGGEMQKVSDVELQKLGVSPGDFHTESGLDATLYKGTDGNYVLAFRGTEPPGPEEGKILKWSAKDVEADRIQRAGGNDISDQYKEGIALADKLYEKLPNLTCTGHSLGGGLCTAASIRTGMKGEVFNPAALADETLSYAFTGEFHNLNIIKSQDEKKILADAREKAKNNVQLYRVDGDKYSESFARGGAGTVQILSKEKGQDAHDIATVKYSIENDIRSIENEITRLKTTGPVF